MIEKVEDKKKNVECVFKEESLKSFCFALLECKKETKANEVIKFYFKNYNLYIGSSIQNKNIVKVDENNFYPTYLNGYKGDCRFIDELNDKINNDEGKIRSLKLTFYKKRTSTKMHISIDGTYRNNKIGRYKIFGIVVLLPI